MKTVKSYISYIMVFVMIFSLFAGFEALAEENENLAVYSPMEKLDLWAVSHSTDEGTTVAAVVVVK